MERRSILKKILASAAGISVFGLAKASPVESGEKEVNNVTEYQDVPLFSGSTKAWKYGFHSR
jgi:2-iminobutanoate/2-iminopropanoate deaminase